MKEVVVGFDSGLVGFPVALEGRIRLGGSLVLRGECSRIENEMLWDHVELEECHVLVHHTTWDLCIDPVLVEVGSVRFEDSL